MVTFVLFCFCRIEFSAKVPDEDCFRVTSTFPAGTEDLAVQQRHCTIAVGAAAVALNQSTFHIFRTLQSVDTPAHIENEPATSSVKEAPQINAPAPKPSLLGRFDTVDVDVASVQFTLADDGSETSKETPILVVPVVELSQLSISLNRNLRDKSELGVSISCTPLESGSPNQQVMTTEAVWRVESAEAKLQYTNEGTLADLGAPLLHLAGARGSVKEELSFQNLCLVKAKKVRLVSANLQSHSGMVKAFAERTQYAIVSRRSSLVKFEGSRCELSRSVNAFENAFECDQGADPHSREKAGSETSF
jgi:hypothetical protein